MQEPFRGLRLKTRPRILHWQLLKKLPEHADSSLKNTFQGETGMDATTARKLAKIIASLEVIESQLANIASSAEEDSAIRTDWPPLPFPAFGQSGPSLPI